jgi:hypothetical protein
LCLGRHTVTGWLSTSGQQFRDWSAAYRLFSRRRCDPAALFAGVRQSVLEDCAPGEPLRIALDDTLLPKCGARIPGVGWRRDPLGPPFQTNLIRAQRAIQFSAAVACREHEQRARMIPVDFAVLPMPARPGRQATAEQQAQYRCQVRAHSLGQQAVTRLTSLAQSIHARPGQAQRPLWLLVDGGYTNHSLLPHLPPQTVLIGRIRKDAKLHRAASAVSPGPGRKRCYGDLAPTPEQLRLDDAVPWQPVPVFAAGARHMCKVKTIAGLRWRVAGPQRLLRLVVIAPLTYRLRKNSKLLYRSPAYLICTDPEIPLEKLVQAYVERWDIEVNFREEKTLFGAGQAQVRDETSAAAVPAFLVASYSLLLLAAVRTAASQQGRRLPLPKWRSHQSAPRTSTQHWLHQLRGEVWGRGLGLSNFSGFASQTTKDTKPEILYGSLASALLYANA